jgi:ABC-2 type transport system permease protein
VSTLAHYAALSRRSITTTARQPTSIVPSTLFPLVFLAMSSAALNRSTQLPGFPPVDSFLQFVVGTTIIQGALFTSIAAGAAMGTDIEGGFFERLIASPVSRTSLLVGRVAGAATFGFLQAWLYFGVTSIFGLEVRGGILGMFLVSIVAATVAAAFGSISVMIALRPGSTEAVQGSFPLLFVFLLVSSAFFPRVLMSGWFHDVATINPLSHMIEGVRGLVIDSASAAYFLKAEAIAGAIFLVGVTSALLALRARLTSGD